MFKIGKLSGPLHSAAAGPQYNAATNLNSYIYIYIYIYRTDQYFQHFETFAKY